MKPVNSGKLEPLVGSAGSQKVPASILGSLPESARSSAVNIALCAVIAGYRNEGAITAKVAPGFEVALPWLADFLGFVIQYPLSVPRLDVSVRTEVEVGIVKPSVGGGPFVLASGGLDSTAALLDAVDRFGRTTAFWCDYGHEYAVAERGAVEAVADRLELPLIECRVRLRDQIAGGTEQFGHIVPARNLLLAALASSHGADSIILAGLADESKVPDKGPRFFAEAVRLLGVPVSSPFTQSTKTDLLHMWRTLWIDVLDPAITITCYGSSGHCGCCRACAKRAVAFAAIGLEDQACQIDPFLDLAGIFERDWLPRFRDFPHTRKVDLLIAIQANLDSTPRGIKEWFRATVKQYEEGIDARSQHLARPWVSREGSHDGPDRDRKCSFSRGLGTARRHN